jgi:hypothetical protein
MAATYLTYDAAVTGYLANSAYEAERSVSQAKDFVTACVALTVLLPSSASDQGSAQSFDMAMLRANQERAQTFIAANAQGSSVRFLGVNTGDFR